MSTITTRSGKGSPLTHDEVDSNFTNLNTDKYESGDSPSFAGLTVASDSSYAIDVSRPSAGNTTLRITGGTTAGNDVVFRADIGNTTGTSAIYFGDSTTNGIGRIMYEHDGDYMRFFTVSAERMRIDNTGKVGIGTSSPDANGLTISSVGSEMIHLISSHSTKTYIEAEGGSGSMWRLGTVDSNPDVRLEAMYPTGDIKFITNSSERMYITSAGNVGIGTTSPSGMLHLSGALPRIYLTDTDTATVSTFSGENGWLTLSAATSRITFNIAGSEKMRIVGDDVGIGTTSPSQKLTVSGTDARIYLTGANTDIDMDNSASGQLSLDGNAYAFGIALNSSGANLYTNSVSRDLIFGVNETEVMRVTDSNVGIGTNSPGYKLHTSGANVIENLTSSTAFAGKLFVSSTTTGFGRYIAAQADDMTFGRYGNAEHMRITSTGNVGIGTTSPSELLEVYGADPFISIVNTGETLGGIKFADAQAPSTQNAVVAFDSGGNSLEFSINNTEHMRITSTGNVGIGLTNPTAPLNVSTTSGTIARFAATTNTAALEINSPAANYIALKAMAGDGLIFSTNNTEKMRITSAGNVGIGIASPQELLHLQKTGGSTIRFQNPGVRVWNIGNDSTSFVFYDSTAAAERMRIDSSGRVTMPNQVSFRVEKTVDQTGTFPGTINVTWDSAAYDVGSNFNFTNDRFYAPVTGKYSFSVSLRADLIDSAAGYYVLKMVTSNFNYTWILDPNYTADLAYRSFSLSTVADMDAGDYCFIQFQQSGGHTTTHVHGATGYAWFSGHLLG